MKNETKERIERLKKELSDYLEIAPRIGIDPEEVKKRVDMYLDDLSRELKKQKK